MLRQLSIRNVVLVDELELEFEPGLGVLTGETGAGKSILLDALGPRAWRPRRRGACPLRRGLGLASPPRSSFPRPIRRVRCSTNKASSWNRASR